ncbi:hypothetical protein [Morganella morganii]
MYYREVENGIEVLAVLHQSQDPYIHIKGINFSLSYQ